MDRRWFALIVLLATVVAFSASDSRFLGPRSIDSILLWVPILLVVALGQFLVVLSGGIDISVGSTLGLSAIATGLLFRENPGLPLWAAFGFALACGSILGATNGVLVAYAKVAPLIATLGAMVAYRGAAFLLSKGDQIDSSMIPERLTSLAVVGPGLGASTLNSLFLISILVLAVVAAAMRYGTSCRAVAAVGSHRNAAHLKGLNVQAIEFWVYVACGAFAGLAGAIYLSRFGFANPGSAGQTIELSAIAAVAIGGTKLTGGSGSVSGVFIGCMILACINVGLSVLGIDANWQLLAYGAVILAAVLIDGLTSRRPR